MKITRGKTNLSYYCITLAIAVLCLSSPAAAWDFNVDPISTNNYMDISTANGGGYYVGFRCAGGGLNALHITTTTSDPYGQVTSVSSDSGTFYLADTGGRGYFDRAILMVAVKVPDGGEEISENLTVRIRASGYQWVSEGIKDQPPNEENITYVTDSINRKFGLSSVKYGPQSWKPAGEEEHGIMYGQSASDEFYVFFVDTGVGILGRNSGITGLTDNGMATIDYTIENYNGETVVFNVYGYALWADAVKDGIAWTNKIGGTVTDKNVNTGASGYSVLLGSSGSSGEFGGATAIDYGGGSDSDTAATTWTPAIGNLNITSSPAGAAVYLDGVDTGKVTNASFTDIPEGEYTVRLEISGYEPLERTGIRVQKGYVTTRHFNLTPAKGSCTVLSDVRGARIFIDGSETLCYANWTFDDITVGNHTISLARDGYDPVSREIVVNDTNTAVVFLGMTGAGGAPPAVDDRPAAEAAGPEPEGAPRAEGAGFLDFFVSLIAGLLGGGAPAPPLAKEVAGCENGPAGDTAPVSEAVAGVPEVRTEGGGENASDTLPAARTGSVYVTSYPSDASISIDGSDTGYTTPHLIYGIKAGAHTIAVKKLKVGSASKTVPVPAGDSTVADFNLVDLDSPKVSVSVTSKDLKGGTFCPNGEPPFFGIPSQATVDAVEGYLTYTDGDYYYSEALPALDGGESIVLEAGDAFGTIAVTSVPDGAEVFIDGVGTGYRTPCTIDTAGCGRHKLMVTKAGCLPVKREIFLVDGRDAIDLTEHFVLEETATGRLTVTSTPSGCTVYLRGIYTGLTTPCTFEDIPIGTYDVGVLFNRTRSEDKAVTVLDGDVYGDTTVEFQFEEEP